MNNIERLYNHLIEIDINKKLPLESVYDGIKLIELYASSFTKLDLRLPHITKLIESYTPPTYTSLADKPPAYNPLVDNSLTDKRPVSI